MSETRRPQLAYSEKMALMLDDTSRRAKAAKIAAVLQHFSGRQGLEGLRIVDVGCSGGIIAASLQAHGADVTGVDIDAPGLALAQRTYGDRVSFVAGDSSALPFADASVDVVVCNHVYEHVVDPWALFREMRRILAPTGMMYLGLGNRLGVMEPHYRLPFLSWLPRELSHRYVRASGRAEDYHEAFMTRWGLQRLAGGLHVWDYSLPIVLDPVTFAAGDVVPDWATRLPPRAFEALLPLVPTYVWVATPTPSRPRGRSRVAPRPVATPPVQLPPAP